MEREKRVSQSSTTAERLKIVVRRLPPNLPEDVFWSSAKPWVTDDAVSWRMFYPGKFRKRLNKENVPSRAYITFKSEEQLASFSREFDGHIFRDKTGKESQAVVEFAPYQKVPTDKKKPDARNATIENDEDYISFLESLNTPAANPELQSMEALIAAAQHPVLPKTTPLLEALKAEKAAHKDKETILRNHAHYREQPSAPNVSKKDESKKKGAATTSTAAATTAALPKQTESPHISKKAAKRAAAAQKAAAAQSQATTAGSSKTAGPSSTGPTPKPPTPKAPRALREQHARQQSAKGSSNSSVPAQPNASAPPSAGAVVTAPNAQQPAPAPAPSRRTRPVIGAASRQFEAALSGAGVAVGPSSGERKSRREREKEKREKEGGNSAPTEKGTSKGKERDVRRNEDISGEGAVRPNLAEPTIKIPNILQRTDGPPLTILQREEQQHPAHTIAPGDGNEARASPVVGGALDGGPARGTGQRGRRRGRGGNRGGIPPS